MALSVPVASRMSALIASCLAFSFRIFATSSSSPTSSQGSQTTIPPG